MHKLHKPKMAFIFKNPQASGKIAPHTFNTQLSKVLSPLLVPGGEGS